MPIVSACPVQYIEWNNLIFPNSQVPKGAFTFNSHDCLTYIKQQMYDSKISTYLILCYLMWFLPAASPSGPL